MKKLFMKLDDNSHNSVSNAKYYALKLQVICCPSVEVHKTGVKRILFPLLSGSLVCILTLLIVFFREINSHVGPSVKPLPLWRLRNRVLSRLCFHLILKFSDKSNPNQPTCGPSIYRHPKKDDKHHALQSTAEAQQWGFGFPKSSDFQGCTVFHVSVPLYLPRQVPHQDSQKATTTQPQMLIFTVSLQKKICTTVQ